MDTLHLVLKSVWYDKIDCGEKTHEYRVCKEYWDKKFNKNTYRRVIFHRGYTAHTMEFEILDIKITTGKNDLRAACVWDITLGRRIS